MKSIARIITLILVYILPFVSCSVSKNITADHEFRKEYSAEFSRFSTCLHSNTVKSRLSVYKSYLVLACPVDLMVYIYMTRIEESALCPAAYLKREEA